jgi:hypothetical protein
VHIECRAQKKRSPGLEQGETVLKVIVGIIVSLSMSGAVLALNWGPPWSHDPGHQGGGPVAAPEIDPASAMSALTLLAGGLAVVRGRKSK